MSDLKANAARDPRIARAARLLRDPVAREDEHAFVLDGEDLLGEALRAQVTVETVFEGGTAWRDRLPAGTAHVVCAPDALRALAAVGQAPRLAAVCRAPAVPTGPVPAGALVLSGVADGGNLGSILRTAAALALPRVELAAGCADPWSRKALRAALGASFTPGLVSARGLTISELAAEPGCAPLAAAVPRGGVRPDAAGHGVAFVLGNERDGLAAEEAAACDVAVTIPAPGFESLNVAAAAAILAWEAARGRGPAGGGG